MLLVILMLLYIIFKATTSADVKIEIIPEEDTSDQPKGSIFIFENT